MFFGIEIELTLAINIGYYKNTLGSIIYGIFILYLEIIILAHIRP